MLDPSLEELTESPTRKSTRFPEAIHHGLMLGRVSGTVLLLSPCRRSFAKPKVPLSPLVRNGDGFHSCMMNRSGRMRPRADRWSDELNSTMKLVITPALRWLA